MFVGQLSFASISTSVFSSAADTYHVVWNNDDDCNVVDDDDDIFCYEFVVDICSVVHSNREVNREKFEMNQH